MDEVRLRLAGIWIALMLVYLLGDVMRIFAGDFVAGEIGGEKMGQWVWLGASALMLIPILMILLTLYLNQPVARWLNIGFAVVFFLFNAFGLPGYPGWYDRFLIVVGLGFNVFTAIQAWKWH